MPRLAALAASLLFCIGGLAGCGGDDDDGEAGETTTVATAATGSAERLSEAQWTDYQASATAFKDANQTAITRLRGCQKTAGSTAEQFDRCAGNVLPDVTEASGDLRATLDGFEGEVGGACEAARAAYSGYLTNYEATASSLDRTLSSGNTTGFQAGIQNINTVAEAGAPARDAFESTCGPA